MDVNKVLSNGGIAMKQAVIALGLLVSFFYAQATEPVINFSSDITVAPCTIDAASKNQSMEIPPVGTGDLPPIGNNSQAATPISISLKDCETTVSTVAITYSAEMIESGPLAGALINYGTSPNVAVQLIDGGDNVVRPDGITATTFDLGTGEQELPAISFKLVSDGPPIPGTINSSVTANFIYN